MTNEKKLVLKRTLIYLLFAFIPPFIAAFIYVGFFGWTVDNLYYQVLTSFSMLCPAIANILTRIVTKEGFENCLFKLKIKGNIRYLVLAFLMSVVYGTVSAFAVALFLMPSDAFGEIFKNFDFWEFSSMTVYVLSASILVSLFGFGEEFGWRGYLTPKLEKLMPFPVAILVSGIIWGMWHAPLIVCGHNFGKDYFMYPYMGFILMCVFCIFIGFYFTMLTKATNSTIPAGIAHMINNNAFAVIAGLWLSGTKYFNEDIVSSINYPAISLSATAVTSLITGIIITLVRKK